jgi:5'-nucleotidase / UDP-sugar diphosphatase
MSGKENKQVLQNGEDSMKTLLKHLAAGTGIVTLWCTLLIAQPDTLTIIHVNDTHSNLDPYGAGAYGGIARAASVIGQWKMTEPNPILLHAGDFMVGNLMFNAYFGVPELQILNQLGFDALVLGNHEFDVGPEYLTGILTEAELDPTFHILGTNVMNLEAVPPLDQIVKSHAIKEVGGIRVGLIGLTTPAANLESNPSPLYIDDNIVEIAMGQVMELKNAGVEVVIVLSHLGLTVDMQIAEYLQGVDAIIGGHSHTPMGEVVYVNGIPIVQAGEFYRYVGKLSLVYDGGQTTVLEYVSREITSEVPEEPGIAGIIEQLQLGIIQQYSEVLGNPYELITHASLHMHSSPLSFDTLDTPVGNLVTTAMLEYVGDADCALEPKGHIVEDIYEGPLTTADLFRVFPYGYDESDGLGFRLASYKLAGAQIAGIMEALFQLIHPEAGDYEYLPQTTGLEFTVHRTPDGLSLGAVFIGGEPLQFDKMYTVVSSDQVVKYLVGLFEITPADLVIYPVSVVQVVRDYAAQWRSLGLTATGKNSVVSVGDVREGKELNYHLYQNFPNPFNPKTTISFTLSRTGYVSLKVYSLIGREVAEVLSGELPPGHHTVTWDGSQFSSGVYFYCLRGNDFTQTRRLVLLK